ncbi:MAG: 50S ribosomal protein L18 [Candidatus Thermoplasmatota archaeon]|nr:50S ribosomal protein L18 [Candidatus Thermoplasmatota archaeon]
MSQGPRYRVPFRRRKEGKTNFVRRRNLLLSEKTRVVVRRSSRYIRVQFVNYDEKGDQVIATAFSRELPQYGWEGSGKSIPAAYLTGYLAAKRAAKSGLEEAVMDIGLHNPHPKGRIFSALKGVTDAGIEVPHNESILPEDDRLGGAHIDEKIPGLVEKVKNQIDSAKEA